MEEFNASWITVGADKGLPIYAENVANVLAGGGLSNSKIRSVYGEMKRIQFGGFDKEKASFYLLRPKVAYALGRDRDNSGLKLFKRIFDDASQYVTDQSTFDNFCSFIEAIIAYLKVYNKRD